MSEIKLNSIEDAVKDFKVFIDYPTVVIVPRAKLVRFVQNDVRFWATTRSPSVRVPPVRPQHRPQLG